MGDVGPHVALLAGYLVGVLKHHSYATDTDRSTMCALGKRWTVAADVGMEMGAHRVSPICLSII